jgi:hypothetical protein
MKIKNAILGLFSVLLSAGAAFASLAAASPDYIHIRYATGGFVCTTAPTCVGTGHICAVTVTITPTSGAPFTQVTPIYDLVSCTKTLTSNQDAPSYSKGVIIREADPLP